MKYLKILTEALLALCMLLCVAALADEPEIDSPFFQCGRFRSEEVDVSGVREENGRLVGTIRLPETDRGGLPVGELRVDCLVPEDFTEEQRVRLRVTRRAITEEELTGALRALGQSIPEGQLRAFNCPPVTTVSYCNAKGLDSGGYFWGQLCDAGLSADDAYEGEYAQAKDALRQTVACFGGGLSENVLHANRRDAIHNDRYSQTSRSDEMENSLKRRSAFEKAEARSGRQTCMFTMVRGLFELRGLPVMDQFYVRSDDGWLGMSSECSAAVRDDGAICAVSISGLPEIVGVEPIDLPAADWRALLRQTAAYLSVSNACGEDCVENGETIYASYAVITDIRPCWVGQDADTLVPGWYCVTEERVQRDDSLVYPWSQYGDAQTLMTLDQ